MEMMVIDMHIRIVTSFQTCIGLRASEPKRVCHAKNAKSPTGQGKSGMMAQSRINDQSMIVFIENYTY